MRHTATHCNTVQHTATHYNILHTIAKVAVVPSVSKYIATKETRKK